MRERRKKKEEETYWTHEMEACEPRKADCKTWKVGEFQSSGKNHNSTVLRAMLHTVKGHRGRYSPRSRSVFMVAGDRSV
jgi:hypothetical protein